jgi:hypothetical protein
MSGRAPVRRPARRKIMPKHRREVAEGVAKALFETERAIDGALATAAGFVGAMPLARQDARLAASVGQDALTHAVEAMAALNEARMKIVAAHEALAVVQGQIGLAEVNFGGLFEKPEYPERIDKVARLREARLAMVGRAA